MDQSDIELIGVILLLVFAATMFYHGTMILYQHRGYTQNDIKKESARMRRRIEELLNDED
jgi:hypothetical protein